MPYGKSYICLYVKQKFSSTIFLCFLDSCGKSIIGSKISYIGNLASETQKSSLEIIYLTAVFFETGAMLTPTKSQMGPIVVQGVRFNHT